MGMQESYPAPAAAPPPKKGGISRVLIVIGALFLCVILGCGGFIGLGMYAQAQDRAKYEAGHAAYLAGNCADAIAQFSELTTDEAEAQAAAELAHCHSFQAAAAQQDASQYSSALDAFLAAADTSSGLDTAISTRLDSLFASVSPDELASDAVCARISSAGSHDRFAAVQTNLPAMVVGCGDYFAEAGRYDEATAAYDQFLAEFPNHELAGDVEAALAETLVLGAKAAGAGNIPAPQLSGSTGTGSAQVVIQNDSPESMRIVFTGPETRIEELEACVGCETFFGVGPAFCPEQGPVGEYTVPPGTYEVLVESRSDSTTTPFVGTWELAAGDVYSSCFFIVESP